MKEHNLAEALETLKPKEKHSICFALNETKILGYEVHPGLLPFVKVNDALRALYMVGEGRRYYQQIMSKLKHLFSIDMASTWVMHLNDARVCRRFGAHPERGHTIQFAPKKKVTVGVKWSLPKGDYMPDTDVLVAPHVSLQCIQRGMWRVKCDAKYREMVSQYLVDYCM
jgi:hypothetical protein